MAKNNVLFVCVHNSARSQMAEAWVRHLYGDHFESESAGLEPGTLNPLVVEVLSEIGIDISKKQPQSVFDLVEDDRRYTWVITVCDKKVAEQCPIFPGQSERAAWSFADPSSFEGSWEEKLEKTRAVRDEIRSQVEHWHASLASKSVSAA